MRLDSSHARHTHKKRFIGFADDSLLMNRPFCALPFRAMRASRALLLLEGGGGGMRDDIAVGDGVLKREC